MSDTHLIPLPRLLGAMRRLVQGFGSSPTEVDAVVGNLVEANLTGHDSHGIGMLPRYADAFLQGGLQPNAHVSTLQDAGAHLVVHRQRDGGTEKGSTARYGRRERRA